MHIRYAFFINFVPGLKFLYVLPVFSRIALKTQAIIMQFNVTFLYSLFTYTYIDVSLAKLPALDAF